MNYNKDIFSDFFFINTSGKTISMVDSKKDGSISFLYTANLPRKGTLEKPLPDSGVILHEVKKRSSKQIIEVQ